VQLRCERIERTGRQKACRGQFDWALARAVASAPVVAEYLVPLLHTNGRALLYRGQWSQTDQRELDTALTPLRARTDQCLARELPHDRGIRHALLVKPLAPCPPAYPRAVGVPAKQPLGAPTATAAVTTPSGG
jgi:16S rRNA (guanine527-N7)-methyltransferase